MTIQAAILATTAYILFYNRTLGRSVMSTQAQVDAVVAQLAKAKTEIVEKIADLQLALDDAGVAEVVDVSELVAAAQALDDIVPDAPEVDDEVPAEVEGDDTDDELA